MDMGLGKSATTLSALSKMDYNRILIVAPLRVAHNTWPDEISKWDDFKHLSFTIIKGAPGRRIRMLAEKTDIHLINYEQLSWLVQTIGMRWPYDTVVFDEFSRMKSPSAKRFKAMKRVRKQIRRVIGLTGTPASNGLMDLWSQSFLLDRGERLGSTFYSFRNRWFIPDYMGYNFKPRPGAEQEIHNRLSDICLSMSAEDYLEMPDRIDNHIEVELPKQARRIYTDLERDLIAELNNETIIAPNAAALANKCLQAANGAVYVDKNKFSHLHDAKLSALADIIEEAAGQSILIAYNYKSDATRIHAAYPRTSVQLDKSASTIEQWNRGEIPILLAHPASAGHGLNLQAGGNIIVWYGLNWSLENYQQFNARLHRQGQGKPVFVHHIVARDTIDEKVLQVLGEKESSQNGLLTAMKQKYLDGNRRGSDNPIKRKIK